MKKIGFIIALLFSSLVNAHEHKPGIRLHNGHISIPEGNNGSAVICLNVENQSKEEDQIVRFESKSCHKIVLKEQKYINGKLEIIDINTIGIPAHSKIELKPHKMYVQCELSEKVMKLGYQHELEVVFDKAGPLKIRLKVDELKNHHH